MKTLSLVLLLGLGLAASISVSSAAQSYYCPSTYYVRVLRYVYYDIYCWNCYRTVRWVCGRGRRCTYVNEPRSNPHTCCTGWTGPRCDIPICNPKCVNNGLCVAPVPPNTCSCPLGYTGTTCRIERCGTAINDCYPGSCNRPTGSSCTCSGGFEGPNCNTLTQGAAFPSCKATILKDGIALDSATCQKNEQPGETYYTRQRDFTSFLFEWNTIYQRVASLPSLPNHVVSFQDGIVSTRGYVQLKDTAGVAIPGAGGHMVCTTLSASATSPAQNINCKPSRSLTRAATHLQELEFTVYSETGAYKVSRDPQVPSRELPYTIPGVGTNESVVFVFDIVPPFHCSSVDECDPWLVNPIIHGPDLLPTKNISIDFGGWNDTDSGLQTAYVDIYFMSWHGEGYLTENQNPILSGHYDLFRPESSTLNFDLPEPGMYSVIARVLDWANNTAYARALVLYDDISEVKATGKAMGVTGSVNTDGDYWMTSQSALDISWSGSYENKFQMEKHLLDPVRPYNRSFSEEQLKTIDPIDDVIGNRTVEGYPNANGIANYSYYLRPNALRKATPEETRKKKKVPTATLR